MIDDVFEYAEHPLTVFMEQEILPYKICDVDGITRKKIEEFAELERGLRKYFSRYGVAYDVAADRIAGYRGLEPGSYDAMTLIVKTLREYEEEKKLLTRKGKEAFLNELVEHELEKAYSPQRTRSEPVPSCTHSILDDPEASRLFQSVARELAYKYEGLDIERVVNVLARTACDAHGSLTEWTGAEQAADSKLKALPPVWFLPSISEALQYLPPADALRLFENEDLELLRMRQLYISYLGSKEAPLYSIRECASAINNLLRYLRENKESLLETGYPRTVFKGNSLLSAQMVELYPVRLPSEVKEEDGEYSYTWSSARWQDDDQPCSYEEAHLAPDLSLHDATRLESMRSRLYDARVEVLQTTMHCLRGNDPEAIWRNSKTILAKCLSADEAYFLLDIDSSLKGSEYIQLRTPLSASGALSTLLSLVGHCMKELTIGTMAKTSEALGELIRKDERGRPYISYASYYEVVGKPEQQKVESACDIFAELEKQETEFWGEYGQRVNSALDKEFEIDVGVTKRAKSEYNSDYKTVAETFGIEPLLKAEEVARILGVPKKTVENLGRTGDLPRHKLGTKTVRFSPADVAEFIRRTRVAPETEEEEDA